MRKNALFSEEMKMADLMNANPKLLLLLSRFGIQLGFGDHSINEVCKNNRVDSGLFLLICNVYSNDDYLPLAEDFEAIEMEGLIPYLLASHQYYLNERIPHIEKHLTRIIKSCPPKFGHTLRNFYDEYKAEIINHFNYEEDTVFPYITSLRNGESDSDYSICQFKQNHSNIEDKLSDMVNILIKYLPADIYPKERIEISLDINQLSSDLINHTMIEERILIPYVETLEKAAR